ncbi:S1C family serine protease [Phenylobacterium sp. LjRoot219]|uniref:S1C family serine protease n=1 Tax=Phenylobacterium sp. LjRoot219 TaxID=3342283 RepID=UPI003ED1724B
MAQARGPAGAASQAGPKIAKPPKAPADRFAQALGGLQPEPASTTRGAADAQIYRRAAPSVVLIVTDKGVGSGSLIAADGQILTNHHVVDGAKQIGVIFKPALEGAAIGKSDLRRAEVLKLDQVADLALIKVEAVPPGVTPLKLGDGASLQVGADVHAIGHPTGEAWTYTRGIVSQIRRAYEWGSAKSPHEATVIQTQTPLNPGNSGGPLLDGQGVVVGVNSFIGDGEGLNYAVSVEDVKTFLARSRDRAATPAAKPADCEWKAVDTETWSDPKGVAEHLDTDCDGEGDATFFTPAKRRDPTLLMVSEREESKGEVDTIYYDANRDGDADWVIYDTDGDGKPDMRGDFRKGEDEPYRWEKISG